MPLFDDRDTDMGNKEININFRVSAEFRDFLYRKAGDLGLSVSDILRVAALLALPQIEAIRGIERIQLEDMRNNERSP